MKDLNFLQQAFDKNPLLDDDQRNLPEIVVVEDDQVFGQTVKKFLERKLGLTVHYFVNPSDCLKNLVLVPENENQNNKMRYCLVTDIAFNEGSVDGLFLIDLLKERGFNFVSIAMTGFASIENAIAATKKGVFQYLTKPFELDVLAELVIEAMHKEFRVSKAIFDDGVKKIVKKETASVASNPFKIEAPTDEDKFYSMIGRSKKMKDVFERIKKVAATSSTVLITGPSGTGKELVANAIHTLSRRNQGPMVSVNCGAIPGELLESELFGHVKGSFTGAISNRKGRFEVANNGTIFLDEIGDMPLLLQVKLLRVLQTRSIEPVGGQQTVNVDVRIVTATHRDLEQAVADGNFREDLYYRLNVIPIRIPSLAERREDIPLLISHFLTRFVSADGRNNLEFTDEALELLVGYNWPGNVRELENFIERLVILRGGSIIRASDLPAKFFESRPMDFKSQTLITLPEDGLELKRVLSDIEDSLINQALERTSGNKNQASKLLGLNRTTLIEKMKKKGMMVAEDSN